MGNRAFVKRKKHSRDSFLSLKLNINHQRWIIMRLIHNFTKQVICSRWAIFYKLNSLFVAHIEYCTFTQRFKHSINVIISFNTKQICSIQLKKLNLKLGRFSLFPVVAGAVLGKPFLFAFIILYRATLSPVLCNCINRQTTLWLCDRALWSGGDTTPLWSFTSTQDTACPRQR